MNGGDAVFVHAADEAEPIPLAVTVQRVDCGARAFDVPIYCGARRENSRGARVAVLA